MENVETIEAADNAGETMSNDVLPDDASGLAILYRLTDRLCRTADLQSVLDAALDAITEGLQCTKCSVLLFDDDAVMRFVAWRGLSDHYRSALEGHTPWTLGTPHPAPIFVPDIEDTDEPRHVREAILREGIRGLAFIPIISQGKVVGKFMTYHSERRDYSAHARALAVTIARQLGFSIERARYEESRVKALRELRDSEERFRQMAEHAPVMIWMSDANGACLHLNRMLREFWSVTEDGLGSFDWRSSMHPDDIPHVMGKMISAVQNREKVSVSGRYRNAGGEYRILETEAHPRFSCDGTFMGLTGVNIDVTERHRAEAQRQLLLAELNHRVKNTLAVVQGLAHQTFRRTDATARKSFEGRLLALAAAHDLLTRSNWESASLHQVAVDTLQIREGERQRISVSGSPVRLEPRAALSIALALHELLTNAMKYGSLSGDSGTVRLDWREQTEGQIRITWQESGGPPVTPPKHLGFGSLLLEKTLAIDLKGRVTAKFDPGGVVCVIDMPLFSEGTSSCHA